MTILTSPLALEVALLRGFEGRAESELSTAELHDFREAVGRARRSLDSVAATMAGEVARRSAPELGAGGLARKEGFVSPQQFLAKTLGTSPGDAGRLIAVGGAFAAKPSGQGGALSRSADDADGSAPTAPPAAQYPHVAAAVAAGELGIEYAALIKRTLDAIREGLEADAGLGGMGTGTLDAGSRGVDELGGDYPSAGDPTAEDETDSQNQKTALAVLAHEIDTEIHELERRLVVKAPTLRLAELRRVCDRERAWRSPKELAAKERRHVENRSLFFGEDADGMVTMNARMDAASAAPIVAWVDAQTKWAFRQRRSVADGGADVTDGRRAGQIRLDALASLARHGLDCETPTSGVKTTVVVRINEKDMREDLGLDGAEGTNGGANPRSELALGECDQLSGPVTVATLRSMAVDAAILPLVLGGASLPLDLGYSDRCFTPLQRIALAERDGGCSWCHAPPSFCEAHHITWWARDLGRTDLDNGVLLCTGCHHRIHRDGWKIQVLDGEVWFFPPPGVRSEVGPRIGGKAHLALDKPQARAACREVR